MVIADEVRAVAERARTAAAALAPLPRKTKDAALLAMAEAFGSDRPAAVPSCTDLTRPSTVIFCRHEAVQLAVKRSLVELGAVLALRLALALDTTVEQLFRLRDSSSR